MWSFVTTDTVHVQRSYVTVDYKKLLFISIEHHANICTKEQYFSYYWNYMGAKYLKHFHLIEINKWRQYKTVNSRYEWKLLTFFNSFKTQ